MKPVRDLPSLSPRVVTDCAEIERLRWFQTNRYFEGGLLDHKPTKLPDDPTIAQSTYFGVYDRNDEIQATARVVRSGVQLPTLEHHPIYPAAMDRLNAMSGCVAEVSRLAVAEHTPHFEAVALLSREFLRFGLRNEHATLLIASVEKPFVRILNNLLGVPLQVIGPSIEQHGHYIGACVPILIDTVECLDTFRRQASRRWEFFMEDLVIDLTTASSPEFADRVLTGAERFAS